MGDRDSYREHFFNHNWKTLRAFPTHRQYPVTIVNKTGDGAALPKDFKFITQSILTQGVRAAEVSFRSGCSCTDARACRYDGCECLSDMLWEEEPTSDDGDSETETRASGNKVGRPAKSVGGKQQRVKFAYHSQGDKAGLLRSRYLDSREPIYECHEGCACAASTSTEAGGIGADVSDDTTCANRVVERGRRVPLQIFRTEDRGWGVRTLVDLRKGQFVDRYLGEILTAREANLRRSAATMARRKDVYLFALDKFSDANSLDSRLAGPPLECDGEFRAGPTRFINHSCSPNLRIFARVGDHADKHIHDLAFFAVSDIAAGDELTFDYVDGIVDLASDARHHVAGMTPCLCKSPNCRKFLW
ncbi:histone-lysine N-methyltransferase SUV39H [Sporothrix brasiliensis 5110]|uniref:Histone-lysine N-methyltransferase SUV39H n=1 Tax=Sporothrix brasiliensis 5110 TaxID=1398154 RepID=A0A0C2IUP3_9PEZI|nr:histone-lysine N-methyltransferase SUV39H [Sporothrix brasiliensis 5110]KIH92881.1 histone-lysine N-methyltransferase SUV39H [Sporothrix brasiliensis 5110]